ncbi:MAG: T9SS type A sorting domain-containing protein, partial [Runella zeae]
PTAYNVGGGGSFCQGGTGVEITLSGSQSGVNYQLKRDNANVGNTVAGTGNALSFGNQTAAGTYTVVATNASTSCTNDMSSSASVTVNDLPTAYNVGGGGSFCQGGTGVEITLSGSQSGVNYQLKRDNANVGNTVAGTGNALSFGNQTLAGTYTVVATNASTSCTKDMSSSASVIVNAYPIAFIVGGGGSICNTQGGNAPSTAISLSSSESHVSYQLFHNNSPVGTPKNGTGNIIVFTGIQQSGNYTIEASIQGSCIATMNGSANVTIGITPSLFSLTGGGSYCKGGAGVSIGLSGSQEGYVYQLRRSNNNIGSPVSGTGNAISFGNQALSGTYTVIATQATTSCTRTMTGSKTVSITNCNARIASAEEVSLDDWAVVAPNPVGGHISVKLVDVANQKVEFQLLSMTGQTLLSHHIYATIPNLTENLDITTLKSGIYLLNVKTLLKTTTIKVVKPE